MDIVDKMAYVPEQLTVTVSIDTCDAIKAKIAELESQLKATEFIEQGYQDQIAELEAHNEIMKDDMLDLDIKVSGLKEYIAELKAEVNYWCDPDVPNVIHNLEGKI